MLASLNRNEKTYQTELEICLHNHRTIYSQIENTYEFHMADLDASLGLIELNITEKISESKLLNEEKKKVFVNDIRNAEEKIKNYCKDAKQLWNKVIDIIRVCEAKIFSKREFYDSFLILLYLKTQEEINFYNNKLKHVGDFLQDKITCEMLNEKLLQEEKNHEKSLNTTAISPYVYDHYLRYLRFFYVNIIKNLQHLLKGN